MVLSVRERLPGLRPVASANEEIDCGLVSFIILSKARLSSLKTSASERIDVNQIFGSVGFGLYSPRAIDKMRSRILSCGMMPITVAFILVLPPSAPDAFALINDLAVEVNQGFDPRIFTHGVLYQLLTQLAAHCSRQIRRPRSSGPASARTRGPWCATCTGAR